MGGRSGGGGGLGGNERRVIPPRLPAPAQAWIGAKVPGMSGEIVAKDPGLPTGGKCESSEERARLEERKKRAKYAGRALSEWALIVGECNGFVERRRGEGVPGLKWVEVPVLGVEGFRRFG